MNTKLSFDGFVIVNFENKCFEVDVKGVGNYFYQPCVMYFKDGSGQPEDEDFEIDNFEISEIRNTDKNEVVTDLYINNKDFEEAVSDALYDAYENGEWTGDEPPEPDEDEDAYL